MGELDEISILARVAEIESRRGKKTTAIDEDAIPILSRICREIGLTFVSQSHGMYGGNCPICNAKKCFFVWLLKRPIRIVCYECKFDVSLSVNNVPKRA